MKFKNRGKVYFFDPHGIAVRTGDKVVVETSRGLELAECVLGNHVVPDETVVQPLRSLARIATKDDLRIEEINRRREKEAFQICKQKIAEHGLDMKLVDVECSFEGNKTMFFFTSDGRVDFRELVKDLASVFRNRIELRQIGVRDEAKMLGGPKPLSEEQVQRLYEIRRKFGMKGKHPADLCPNAKAGKPSCHSCGGNCSCGTVSSTAANDAALIAEITKKVLASLS